MGLSVLSLAVSDGKRAQSFELKDSNMDGIDCARPQSARRETIERSIVRTVSSVAENS